MSKTPNYRIWEVYNLCNPPC